MKTINAIAVLCLTLGLATFASAQDASYFEEQIAPAVEYPVLRDANGREHGTMLKTILDSMAATHKFSIVVASGLDPKVLTERQIIATFKQDVLDRRLTKLVRSVQNPPLDVSFNGQVLTIFRRDMQTTGVAPEAPASEHGRPELPLGKRASDNRLEEQEDYVDNRPVPPAREPAYFPPPPHPTYRDQPMQHARFDANMYRRGPSSTEPGPYLTDYYGFGGYQGSTLKLPHQPPVYVGDPYNYRRYGYGGYGSFPTPVGGPFSPFWGMGGYWGYDSDELYNIMNRDPRYLREYGLIKINGPDDFLRKVRVVIDGADVTVGSKANEKWNQPIVVPAGPHTLKFVYEGKEGVMELERTIHITPMAATLAATGKIKPMDFRISQNEFRHGQNVRVVQEPAPKNP